MAEAVASGKAERGVLIVLALGGRLTGTELALEIVAMWRPDAMRTLERVDPEVTMAIRLETERRARNLELILSENVVSEAVLEAVGG